MNDSALFIVILASFLDYLIGDPWGWTHPVQIIGWCIDYLTRSGLKLSDQPYLRRIFGVFLGIGIILATIITSYQLIAWTRLIHPALSFTLQVILLASCFAGKSLRNSAEDVLNSLQTGDIQLARNRLKLYVGRDTDYLSEKEILRAVLETISENTTDGVTAPLFYAILGAFLPIGIVPCALGYKASSTLDSMIGYRCEPYLHIGWFSAKLEDYLTLIPCRLTVLILAFLSGKPKQVLRLCWRDAIHDPSPNSGWSECIFASILNVQLGGENYYQGQVKFKPLLGDNLEPITAEKVYYSIDLMRVCFLSFLLLFCYGLFFLEHVPLI